MKRALFSLLMTAALCLSCDEVVIEETTGNLIGIVADMTTGEPVPVVNLTLEPGGASTVTGSDGSFSFIDLEEGSYTVSLVKKGYKSGNSTVNVKAGTDSEVNLLIERVPAVITVDRDVLDFGDNASMNTLSFNIVNNNYVDLKYEIIENCVWIVETDPKSGDLPYGKTGTIVLTIDREQLQAGVNESTVVVRTTGEGSSELLVRATGLEKKPASLNISDATEIKSSSVRLNAVITDSGAPSYTERGFVYGETSMPDFDNAIAKVTAPVTEETEFSVKLEGLELGKTYYARAYAVNTVGESYSTNQVTFTTVSSPAAVSITDASVDAKTMSVMLYASITEQGDPKYYDKGFVYSDNVPNPTLSDTRVVVEEDNAGKYEACISDLKYSTDYYYRAYVTNADGTSYSEAYHVNISPALPEVEYVKGSVDDQNMSVSIVARIITDGNPQYSERGVVYSASNSSPTVSDMKALSDTESGELFETLITDLDYDCKYYFRAYAKNMYGVGYSEPVSVNVESVMPVVLTHEISEEDKIRNVAVLHGQITEAGKPKYYEKGFVYSDVYQAPTIDDNKFVVEDISDNGKFDYRTTELSSENTYYVRAYALSKKGVVYGDAVKVFEKDWVELKDVGIAVQKEDAGKAKWDHAEQMCKNSVVESYTDWRLPTVVELKAMYKNAKIIGGFHTYATESYDYYCDYWTSDNYANDDYWVVRFWGGSSHTEDFRQENYVRCVRTLEQE